MLRGIEIFVNVIGWLQIVGASFFLSIGIGVILYYSFQTDIVYYFAVLISILGLIIGVIWATKIWKSKEGVISYIAKADANPEMDEFFKKQAENETRP